MWAARQGGRTIGGVTANRHFNPHDAFPADQPNSLGEFISTAAFNFVLQLKPGDPTTLQVPAGTGNDQVGIGIVGRWRYNSATVERASLGGSARTLDVYVTASDNSFAPGNPEIDSTVYSFALAVVEHGATPTGVALYRLVATAAWTGSAFSGVNVVIGGTLRGAPTGDIVGTWDNMTVGAFPAGRVLSWAGDTDLYRSAAATLKTDGALVVGTTLTSGIHTAYAATSTSSASAGGTHWWRAPKNTVSAFIGDNDSTAGYGAGDYSGALRFNGAGILWGDIAYRPNAGAAGGHFGFYLDGTTVGSGPFANIGVAGVYSERTGVVGAIHTRQPGDADYRMVMFSDCQTIAGGLQFGTGASGGRDAVIWRPASSSLQTNSHWTAATLTAPGGFDSQAAAGAYALYFNVPGDTAYRLFVDHAGTHTWGPGNAGGDLALYRSSAGIMGITGNVGVSGYVNANSMTAATTLTATTGILQKTSAAGVSSITVDTGPAGQVAQFALCNQGAAKWTLSNNGANDNLSVFNATTGTLDMIFTPNTATFVRNGLTLGPSGANATQITYFNGAAYTYRRSASGRTSLLAMIDASGSTTTDSGYSAGIFEVFSDRRLKEGVTALDGSRALATIRALRGVKHGWIGTTDRRDYGFIAQEVAEVEPELVSQPEDDMWGVDYMRMTPLLVEALKHVAGRVDELERAEA
jgi:hypothetical protein